MNKNAFKLIFSKVHAMLIAVGETARGYNHNTSSHELNPNKIKNSSTTSNSAYQSSQAFEQSKTVKLTTLVLSLWTALTPILPSVLYSQTAHAQSQIQHHAGGDPNYRPTLLRSDNNIPIVNIRTINDNGVSRNQFGQFDIDEKGVVLNNARFATDSQLAGRIDGNMWLLSGEARTIVNEIFSQNPTKLNGKIEVAGQTANVIIASPSGLTINGGGFINANNSVLTTGVIDYHNGVPVGVQVDKGAIQVLDKGLSYQFNGKDAPYFAQLLSQTANIHGKITGGEQTFVQVVTGQNAVGLSKAVNSTDIKPKSQNAPSDDHQRVSVDIGQLGQVYAGGIHIVSTADGMGVKQAGQLKAHHIIHLQADGKIVNSGHVETISDNSQILIKNVETGHDIVNTGHIHSKKDVLLVSANDIQNQKAGKILGDKQTALIAQNDISFDKIDYQKTDTKLVLQAGHDIRSQERVEIDTTNDISVKAGRSLNLTGAHLQSRNNNLPKVDQGQLNEHRNIEIISQDLTLKESHIANQAGTVFIGAKNLTADHNAIHSDSHQSVKNTNVNIIADSLSLTHNEIKTNGHVNLASNHDLNTQNNHIQATTLSMASTANITSQNNNINTSEQLSIASGQNISLNNNQIHAGSLTARSEQGQLTIADSQIHSDSHLYLQAKTQQSLNNQLTAQDSISIHSQDTNRLTDTQIKAGKHLAISSKTADVVIDNRNQSGASIDVGGLISVQADKAVNLNQSTIQGGAIALHSKNADVDWQNAKLKTVQSDVLANDDKLKPANGSLTIKSHNDMTIMAGKTITTVGDLELQSDGNLILQGESGDPNTGKGGRGSEKVVTIGSVGAVYLKGKNTDIQGSNITARGAIQAYAVDGNLTLSGVKSDIAPLKDEERISELTAKISRIDEQINTLNTDSQYQSISKQQTETGQQLAQLEQDFKALPNPSATQKQKFNEDQKALSKRLNDLGRALTERQKALGIDKDPVQLEQDKNIAQKSLKIAQTPFNGSENKGAVLNAGSTIRLVAKNGIAIEQAHLKTPDSAIIQALGTGKEREIGKDEKTGEVLKMPFAIRIEGLTDVYQRGEEKDDGFSLHNNYQATTIQADKGILIQAIGTGDILPTQSTASISPYNVLMVGGDYQAKDGTIKIQSLGSTLLQAGQDSIYDRETNTVKKGKIKRKTIITTITEQIQDADVVKLTAKDIQIQAGDHIYAYGTAFNAQDDKQNKNHVLLQAGDSVRLLAVEEINQKDVDVKKISRFAGIKYKKSKTTDSHQVLSELPTKVLADITHTQSGANTELQGTQFHTLEKANIVAGVGAKAVPDAKIILSSISTLIKEEQTREYNNIVWQSVAGSGSINETRTLPSFTGVEPTFTATGSLAIQVPINKDDPEHKQHLVNVLTRLSEEPGFAYLKDAISREDVDYIAVKLAQEQWDYEQEGLTAAAAALIAIALTIATAGAGAAVTTAVSTQLGALGVGAGVSSVMGAMAGAAFQSLVSQAGVTLINNKGDMGKTLKDLGKSSTVKQIAQATITAGVAQGIDNYLDKALKATQEVGNGAVNAGVNDKLVRGIVQGAGGALTENLLYGTDFETALKNNLMAQLVDGVSAHVYSEHVKGLDTNAFIDNISHKLAAGLTGCISAKAKDKSCEAGAVGAVIGEMVGDWMTNDYEVTQPDGRKVLVLSDKDYNRILNTAKLTAGSIALLYDFDVDTATQSAGQVVKNNSVFEREKIDLGDGLKRMSLSNLELAKMAAAVGDKTAASKYISLSATQNLLTIGTDIANTPFEGYNMVAGLRDGNYEQAKDSGISLLMLGLGAKYSPPRAQVKGVAGQSIYRGTAGNLARAFADNIRNAKFTGNKNRPTTVSVTVDLTTGKSYYGVSGWAVKSNNINPILKHKMPPQSLEKWCIENCAEFNSVNNALNAGAKLENLEVHTVYTKSGEAIPRCQNCKQTTSGTKVTSDK